MDLRVNAQGGVTQSAAPTEKPAANEEAFSFALKRLGSEGLSERIGGLITDITAQGKRIADHMDIADMRRYRSLVSDFISEVVTNSHKFERDNFLDRRGRHRVYTMVRLVNTELDNLAQELLAQEKNHLKILEKTDEIQGLLLDMVI